jgi:F-type H+-transporting ATPase subunit b
MTSPSYVTRWTRIRSAAVLCALIAVICFGLSASTASLHAAARVATDAAEGAEHADSWMPVIAKTFNLAILIGVLTYFLRSPLVTYLRTRSEAIRKGLVDAAALRVEADARLAEVRARLTTLPGELATLRQQGTDELAAERVRLAEATTVARERVVARTRREIEMQARVAHRNLLEYTAELSVVIAKARIEREMTAADQVRLLDRYATEVQS